MVMKLKIMLELKISGLSKRSNAYIKALLTSQPQRNYSFRIHA
jgi:hypothetical protein